jgi:GNAT superfamily N-acetyltransferase
VPVRPAVEADLGEICALIRELAEYERLAHEVVFDEEEVRRHLFGPDPAASVLMAETDEGEVAGFALYFRTFSTFLGKPGIWLEDLFVRPQHRKRGYGLDLLQELRRLSEARVEWAVLDWNEPSIRFYRTLGAEPVEGWTRYRWLPAPSS